MFNPLDYRATTIRTASALTGTYVAALVIGNDTSNTEHLYADNELLLYINLSNLGNMTTCEFKIEFSDDGTDWYQESFATYQGGIETDTLLIHQLSATGEYRIATQLKDKMVRVSFKGSGGSGTGSMLSAIAIYGVA